MDDLFRNLTFEEAEEFRAWAKENFNPETDQISDLWHPVCQAECARILFEDLSFKAQQYLL